MTNVFVIVITGDAGAATLMGTPLRLAPYETTADARGAINWQSAGGFDPAGFVIATPDRNLPGVMRTLEGKPVLVGNNFWTHEAFARFVLSVWG